MSAPQQPQRRVPLVPEGFRAWTDEELDAMAEVTPADIARTKASVPPAMRRLLDAEDVTDGNDQS